MKRVFGMVMMTALMSLAAAAGADTPVNRGLLRVITSYPNPFDSRLEATTIRYLLPATATVRVKIVDLFGNDVREYPPVNEAQGLHTLVWDGTDNAGRKVAKGGYLCVIETAGNGFPVLAMRKIGVVH